MIIENIYTSLIVAAIATYFCRFMGVIFSSRLSPEGWLFDWIKCISIGIIVAVISKIIFFPEGFLEETSNFSRIISTISLLIIYFLFKRNILLAVILSTTIFTILNY